MFTSKRALLRTLEREREAHTAQVRELVETICHLTGRPQTPPAAPKPAVEDSDRGRYVSRPEMLPDE
jgi:hypothetical protein